MNIKSIITTLIILIIVIILFNYITNDSITKYLLKFGFKEQMRKRLPPHIPGYPECIEKANGNPSKVLMCRRLYNES